MSTVKGPGCGPYMEGNRVKTLEGPWVWPITKGRMGLIDLGVANLWRQNGVKGLTSQNLSDLAAYRVLGFGQNGVNEHEPLEGSWVWPISEGRMGLTPKHLTH